MTTSGWRLAVPALVLGAWLGLTAFWTHGFRAFTSFSSARVAAGPVPRRAPRLEVVDEASGRWDVAAPSAQYRLVQVMYLRCPDVCLIAMAKLARLAHGLADLEPSRLRVVSLSLDHDSPAALHDMWVAHGSPVGWSLAALTADPIEPTMRELGVFMFRRKDGLINHGLDILLLDPSGRIVRVFSADEDPDSVANAVRSEIR